MTRPGCSDPAESNKSGDKDDKSSRSLNKAETILSAWRFYIDEETPFPPSIEAFVAYLKKPREMDVTPKSKAVAKASNRIKKIMENAALSTLLGKLVYRSEDGGPLIAEGYNEQWWDRVPRPTAAYINADDCAAAESVGSPPWPKPDVSYGYSNSAFAAHE